jgi:UDP:flavonoid glycosyltransferase YjiC (YdhE family)
MTHITIIASSTRGEVQPYVALGKGLKDAGYSVRLLASENFATLATDAGLDFALPHTGFDVLSSHAHAVALLDECATMSAYLRHTVTRIHVGGRSSP